MAYRPRTFMATLESLHKQNPPAPKPVSTLEGIAFQENDQFGPDLEELVTQVEALIEAKAIKRGASIPKDMAGKFEALIFKRLGIKVELITNDSLAATIPNVFVPHNSLIREDIRWIYEMYEEIGAQHATRKLKDKSVMGNVDTAKAKVSGWFSDQVAPLFINFFDLITDYKMSPAEVTSIILHELGHDWAAIELSSNINQTNRILADVAKNISADGTGDVEVIYRDIKRIYPAAERDIAEGLASGNNVVMSVSLYRLAVGTTQTLMFDGTYDKTTFEALADQFPARFGYSLASITSLEKLEAHYSEYEMEQYVFGDAVTMFLHCSLLLIISGIMACTVAALIAPAILMALISIFVMKLSMNTQRISKKDMTYDNIRDRYTRSRNQLVERIKNRNINAAARKVLIEQIDAADEIIKRKQVFVSFIQKFTTNWLPSDKRAALSIEAQREVENMIANDIFVSANRLSLKA